MERRELDVKHINVDNQSDDVKRFLLSLDVDAEGSILELEGKEVLCVHPVRPMPLDADDLASAHRGFRQMEAGQGRPFTEADTDIRRTLGFQPPQ
jgi:hypothetical protein